MPGGDCQFSDTWLIHEKYREWIALVASDRTKARCKVCFKNIDIANMGESALRSHAKGGKHVQKMAQTHDVKTNPSVPVYFRKLDKPVPSFTNSGPLQHALTSAEQSTNAVALTSAQSSVDKFIVCHATTAAEKLWALKVTTSHMFYSSLGDINTVFTRMLPDSDIAEGFTCGVIKCSLFMPLQICCLTTSRLAMNLLFCLTRVLTLLVSRNRWTYLCIYGMLMVWFELVTVAQNLWGLGRLRICCRRFITVLAH